MGEESGRGSGRVRLFVGNRGSGRVNVSPGRVGSGRVQEKWPVDNSGARRRDIFQRLWYALYMLLRVFPLMIFMSGFRAP